MFLLTMFANPLVRKIAIIVACVAAFLLVARWYGNREYYKGVDEGVKLEAERLLKAKEAEWKLKEDAIAQRADQVVADGKIIEGKRAEIARMRGDLDITLAEIRARGQMAASGAGTIVSAIPASDLDNALRAKSDELARAAAR